MVYIHAIQSGTEELQKWYYKESMTSHATTSYLHRQLWYKSYGVTKKHFPPEH